MLNPAKLLREAYTVSLECLPRDLVARYTFYPGFPGRGLALTFEPHIHGAGIEKLRLLDVAIEGNTVHAFGRSKAVEALATLWEHLFEVRIVEPRKGSALPRCRDIVPKIAEMHIEALEILRSEPLPIYSYELALLILRSAACISLLNPQIPEVSPWILGLDLALEILYRTRYRFLAT